MKYNQQLKQMMSLKEISQKELSVQTGIGKSSISQYVNGRNVPTEDNKKKIEIVLGEFEEIEVEEKEVINNVPVSTAARKLGKGEQFIRVGLQNGVFDWGYAVKVGKRFNYHISPKKFKEYIGE